MAQRTQSPIAPELASLLKTDDKGWKISIFEDQIIIKPSLCENCNAVCCDAVELGCDHNDSDICLYCNECLNHLIQDNDNKCPINSHSDPIIIPNRSTRRQISKSIVICPYSIQYKQNKKKKDNNNGQIIDTIDGDEKEGIAAANNNDDNNDKNNDVINKTDGCHWKGTFNELITKHFGECVKKNNPSFTQIMKIKKLQNENKILNKTIDDQKQKIHQLQQQMDRNEQKRQQNKTEINQLKQQNGATNKIIGDQKQKIFELQQKVEIYERKKQQNKGEIDNLKQENNEHLITIKTLTNIIDSNQKEIQSLRKELDTEKKINEEQKQNNANSHNHKKNVSDEWDKQNSSKDYSLSKNNKIVTKNRDSYYPNSFGTATINDGDVYIWKLRIYIHPRASTVKIGIIPSKNVSLQRANMHDKAIGNNNGEYMVDLGSHCKSDDIGEIKLDLVKYKFSLKINDGSWIVIEHKVKPDSYKLGYSTYYAKSSLEIL